MTTTPAVFLDDRNQPLAVGDAVFVVYVNRDRGAEVWMAHGVVAGFGRSRVKVQFPSRTKPQAVGAECLRITAKAA